MRCLYKFAVDDFLEEMHLKQVIPMPKTISKIFTKNITGDLLQKQRIYNYFSILEAFSFNAFRDLIKWGIILTTWNVNNEIT